MPYLARARERSDENVMSIPALANWLMISASAQERSAQTERRNMLTKARQVLEKLPAETRERAEAIEIFERLAKEEATLHRGG